METMAAHSFISIKIRVHHPEGYALGPGKADLLEAIEETHSIAAAGRKLGLSYWKTRSLLDEMNRCFKTPVVITTKGGTRGGGSLVTETGNQALKLFREMERRTVASISKVSPKLRALLA